MLASMMRSRIVVAICLALVAAILPATRAVHTIIGDAQIVYALALVALAIRQTWTTLIPLPDVQNPEPRGR